MISHAMEPSTGKPANRPTHVKEHPFQLVGTQMVADKLGIMGCRPGGWGGGWLTFSVH